jgi:curved DNA-binding protein CbpA
VESVSADMTAGAKLADPWNILGVKENPTPQELKAAFRQAMREVHSDSATAESARGRTVDIVRQAQEIVASGITRAKFAEEQDEARKATEVAEKEAEKQARVEAGEASGVYASVVNAANAKFAPMSLLLAVALSLAVGSVLAKALIVCGMSVLLVCLRSATKASLSSVQ